MTSVALRPATPADSEFCYHLHKAAMGDYITAIWGWNEQVQRGQARRRQHQDHHAAHQAAPVRPSDHLIHWS